MLSAVNVLLKGCFSTGSDSFLGPVNTFTFEGCSKTRVTLIEVTTFLGVNNFQNIKAMKLMFSCKLVKILFRLLKCNKICGKCTPFLR